MLFVSPWAIGFIVFIGGPIVFSILFSFTRYDVLSPARYVGAANYLDVLRDGLVLKSIGNTAFMILRIPLGMAVSLAIALMLNRAVRAIGFYRTAFYMPAIVPMVAGSLLWVWMFNPTQGLINRVLLWFTNNPPQWLNDPRWSKPAMILMSLWAAGAGMIIWLAACRRSRRSFTRQPASTAPANGEGSCTSRCRCSARTSCSTRSSG
jgi:multiple sugar transport system permease protein